VRDQRYTWLGALSALVATVTAGLGVWLTSRTSSHSSNLTSWSLYIAAGAGGAALIPAVWFGISGYRSNRSRSQYRSRIADIVKTGVSSPEDIDQAQPGGLDQVVARYVVDRDAAERRLAAYLPANPRRAKRLINHERLYRQIGEYRGIFGGDPELTYDHMARWSLIVEEWPRLAAALTREPAIMKMLETAEDIAGLQQVLDARVPGVKATDDLFKVMCVDGHLSPVLARVVRFEKAPAPPVP
jgi:hypothetical protein